MFRSLFFFSLLVITASMAFAQAGSLEPLTPVGAPRLLNGLGWNVTLDQEWEFEKVQAARGKEARFQFSWDAVEGVDGTLKLSAKFQQALQWCAKYHLEPMIVAAYGGPRKKLLELTVTQDVEAGVYRIPVRGDVAKIRVPYCHVLAGKTQLVAEGKWAYYGALIDAVDVDGGAISLGAKTKAPIAAGTVLTVNELRYPSIATEAADDPSTLAYLRYTHFLAEQIAALGLKGTVEIWNEPPWAHDPWDHRSGVYDTPPATLSKNSPNWGILRALLAEKLPEGVRYTWGGSHKSGTRGVLSLPPPAATREQVTASVVSEGWHPYGPTPEWNSWNPARLEESGNAAAAALEGSNQGSNFKQGRRKAYEHLKSSGWTVPQQVSEAGLATSDQLGKARWVVRFFLVNMCLGPQPQLERVNFYRLAEEAEGYAMIDRTTRAELPAYVALKELMNDLARMGEAPLPDRAADLPTVTGEYHGEFPLVSIPITGRSTSAESRNRVLFVCFQRTYAAKDSDWLAANPKPALVHVQIPPGFAAEGAIDLVTRKDVPVTTENGVVSFKVSANPVALRTVPK
jgi:hypothetical protein